MKADNYTVIGYDHIICQDYSRANNDKNVHVIISDGCSSAKESDWGARLLTMAMQKQLEQKNNHDNIYSTVGHVALSHCRAIGITTECLRATLLSAVCMKDTVQVGIFGDGVIVGRNRNSKELMVISEEYSSGAPYYLAYDIEQGMREKYLSEFGNGKFRRDIWYGSELESESVAISDEDNKGATSYRIHFFNHDVYDLVAIFSDGVKSFIKTVKAEHSLTHQEVSMNDILKELLAFKNYGGSFVHRRCQKAFKNLFQPLGYKHTDDFSMGVIYVDE